MPRHVSCQSCHARLRIPDDFQGKAVRCAKCSQPFRLDSSNPPPTQTPPVATQSPDSPRNRNWLLPAALGTAALLGTLAFFLIRSKSAPDTAQETTSTTPTPSRNSDLLAKPGQPSLQDWKPFELPGGFSSADFPAPPKQEPNANVLMIPGTAYVGGTATGTPDKPSSFATALAVADLPDEFTYYADPAVELHLVYTGARSQDVAIKNASFNSKAKLAGRDAGELRYKWGGMNRIDRFLIHGQRLVMARVMSSHDISPDVAGRFFDSVRLSAAPQTSFVEFRRSFQTKLRDHNREFITALPTPPEGFTQVDYPAPAGQFPAFLAPPSGNKPIGTISKKKQPPLPAGTTLVYLHGGNGLSEADFVHCNRVRQYGVTVFAPTWRAANGNPGPHEFAVGELDDLLAALNWLASQPGIDRQRIYVFGNADGGMLAGLLSLLPDVPVRFTGSRNGLHTRDTLTAAPHDPPFDTDNPDELRLRLLLKNLPSMHIRHFAWIDDSPPFDTDLHKSFALYTRTQQSKLLKVTFSAGITASSEEVSLESALGDFLRQIAIDVGVLKY